MLGITAPITLTHAPTSQHHFIADLVVGSAGFQHRAGQIDARHHRELTHDLAFAGYRQTVLVVERGVFHRHQHITLGQIVESELLDGGDGFLAFLGQDQGFEGVLGHACLQ